MLPQSINLRRGVIGLFCVLSLTASIAQSPRYSSQLTIYDLNTNSTTAAGSVHVAGRVTAKAAPRGLHPSILAAKSNAARSKPSRHRSAPPTRHARSGDHSTSNNRREPSTERLFENFLFAVHGLFIEYNTLPLVNAPFERGLG